MINFQFLFLVLINTSVKFDCNACLFFLNYVHTVMVCKKYPSHYSQEES